MGVNGIYGLSGSGLDIESMVKVGMLSKQSQYDKMYKTETKMAWEKEAYADLYSNVKDFSDKLSDYKMQSKMNAMQATSGNSGVVTATANGAAASMTHTVEVKSLATNAYLMTKDSVQRANGSKSSVYLKDIVGISAVPDGKSGSDTAISFDIGDGGTGKNTVSFTYDDVVKNNLTLNDLVSRINASGANITASYDSTNDSFALYQKNAGVNNKIEFSVDVTDDANKSKEARDMGAKLLDNLHLAQVTQSTKMNADGTSTVSSSMGDILDMTNGISAAGTGGHAVIDGKTYNLDDGNKITVANVIYNLQSVGSTTMSVTQDTDSIVERVQSFVDDYNDMIDELNDKYYEKKYSDYGVLTKSQEDKMSEEEIKKWNEKAQSGLLNHSTIIGKMISKMRDALTNPVDGVSTKYNSAYELGIDTKTDQGHIELDEEKLRKALAADPNCVYETFGTLSKNDDSDENGIAQRLGDIVNDTTKEIKKYAGTSAENSDGSTLGTNILDWLTKMSDFKSQMDAFEDQLYKKYDAMEVALSSLGSQLNYITGGN